MDNELRFFRCDNCGNIIIKLHDSSVSVVCCGERMKELEPGVTDGAMEKHVPKVTCEGNKVHVQVGSEMHPSTNEHYIEFIAIKTTQGIQIRELKSGVAPVADFLLADGEKCLEVYEYCNIHGLWKC